MGLLLLPDLSTARMQLQLTAQWTGKSLGYQVNVVFFRKLSKTCVLMQLRFSFSEFGIPQFNISQKFMWLELWWFSNLGTLISHVHPIHTTSWIIGSLCISDVVISGLLGTVISKNDQILIQKPVNICSYVATSPLS